jgi:hypothetical protein
VQRGERRVRRLRRRELVLGGREELLELRGGGPLRPQHAERCLGECAQPGIREGRLHGAELRRERPVRVPRPHPREGRLGLVRLRDRVQHAPQRARRRREERIPLVVEGVRLVERRERLSELHQPVVQPHLIAFVRRRDVVDLHVGERRVERPHEIPAPPRHRAHLRDRARAHLRGLVARDGWQNALVHVVRVFPFCGRVAERLKALPAPILGERRRPEPIAEHPVEIVPQREGRAGLPRGVDLLAGGEPRDGEHGTEADGSARKREAKTTTFHESPRAEPTRNPRLSGRADDRFRLFCPA